MNNNDSIEIEASQAEQKIISNLKRPDETKVEFMRHLLNIVDMHLEGFINGHFSAQKKEQDLPAPQPTGGTGEPAEPTVSTSETQSTEGLNGADFSKEETAIWDKPFL